MHGANGATVPFEMSQRFARASKRELEVVSPSASRNFTDNGPSSRVYRLTANRLEEIGRTRGVLAGFALGNRIVLVGRNEIYLRK